MARRYNEQAAGDYLSRSARDRRANAKMRSKNKLSKSEREVTDFVLGVRGKKVRKIKMLDPGRINKWDNSTKF